MPKSPNPALHKIVMLRFYCRNNIPSNGIFRVKISAEKAVMYICEKCDFECSYESKWLAHISTRKHKMVTVVEEKKDDNFYCKSCDYKCSYESKYMAHLTTLKHKMVIFKEISAETRNDAIICDCGKIFKFQSGLSRHRKTCNIKMDETPIKMVPEPSGNSINPELIIQLIKENSDLKTIIMEQNNKNTEYNSKLIEQNTKMLEMVKTASIVNNMNSNNTTNNTQFNLNFFLNEQCKNAMNITDFAKNIQIQFNDLENIGRNGYVEGITSIIVKNLNTMDLYSRPFHCTDLKRETLYIKDENEWNKDTLERSKLKQFIQNVANKNEDKITDWCIQHPESMINNHRQNDFYLQMYRNVLGGCGKEEQNKLDDKIIRNISKEVYVDKTQT